MVGSAAMRALAGVAALAACALVGATLGRAAPAADPACTGAYVKDGKLVVGTDNPAFPPWFGGGEKKGSKWKINDPSTGKGYESAVAYEVARRLRIARAAVEWTAIPFTKSFAPGKKPFDFYLAQVSYKPAREKAVDFSVSYYDVNQAVVGLKANPIARVKTIAGLKRFRLGAPIGTTSYDYIVKYVKPSSKPKVYDTLNDGVTALKNRQIDGLVVDYPSTGYITAVQVPNSTVVGRLPNQGVQEYFGLVLEKDSLLLPCVNTALRAMRADGTLKRLEARWLAQAGGAPILK